MSAKILTGYTGDKNITPAMDAAVYRSIVGVDGDFVLAEGGKLVGSMPSINQFIVMGGMVSLQGHMIQVSQETLSVDTCDSGYERIDLVVLRFNHNNDTLIDSAALAVIKGTEVPSGSTPATPSHYTGVIDNGAAIVDMPLYKIRHSGSQVSFEKIHERGYTMDQMRPLMIDFGQISSLPQTVYDSRIIEEHGCEPGDCYLSDTRVQDGEWTATTQDGAVTLSGVIDGTSSVKIWLTVSR